MKTEQTNFWEGEFGKEYTDRNTLTPAQLDKLYLDFYGVTTLKAQNQKKKEILIKNFSISLTEISEYLK